MKIVFMGSPEFARTTLAALAARHEVVLVVTQPDKRRGRGRKVSPPAVKVEATERGLEVFQPRSARTGELAERLKSCGGEIAVVVAYGKILPTEVLTALPLGCINVHASLLPELRGAAPIQWAVLEGRAVTGVSIMQLDEGMDTGPVFATREVAVEENETSGQLFERLAPIGSEVLLEVLETIEAGTANAIAQDHARATHARMLGKSDGVIDWNASAAVVHNQIRGVDPWPGGQTAIASGQDRLALKVFGSRILKPAQQPLETVKPGQVVSIDDELIVACGDGQVALAELQPAGSRRMPALECARGRKIGLQTVFLSTRATSPSKPSSA